MKARRIFYDKAVLPDGAVVEMTIWQLPRATTERPHGLKYSLFYGRDGQRVVGYDNERGKGDHKHHREVETRYKFESVEKMVADFLADVERARGEHDDDK
jgi:hypothetical protein